MKMPEEFMRLINDFHPDNLNLMNSQDICRLFIHTREMAEALEYVARGPRPDDSDHTVAQQALTKFKEWK